MTESEASVLTDESDLPTEPTSSESVPSDAEQTESAMSEADESDDRVDAVTESVMEVAEPRAPDRADAPVSEITERFLRAVVAQIPLDRIEELHLFSPLRQGGVETGIAVVAARVPVIAAPVEMAPELPLDDETVELEAQDLHAVPDDAIELAADEADDADDADDAVGVEDADDMAPVADVQNAVVEESVDAPVDAPVDASTEPDAEDVTAHAEVEQESPYADDDSTMITLESVAVLADEAADDETIEATLPDAQLSPIERHTVYTARYRLVQKGPERGRWEADVVAEADAPLITVEMVVRGVQRRAGEESEILRYSARQIAKALHLPWPIPTSADVISA